LRPSSDVLRAIDDVGLDSPRGDLLSVSDGRLSVADYFMSPQPRGPSVAADERVQHI